MLVAMGRIIQRRRQTYHVVSVDAVPTIGDEHIEVAFECVVAAARCSRNEYARVPIVAPVIHPEIVSYDRRGCSTQTMTHDVEMIGSMFEALFPRFQKRAAEQFVKVVYAGPYLPVPQISLRLPGAGGGKFRRRMRIVEIEGVRQFGVKETSPLLQVTKIDAGDHGGPSVGEMEDRGVHFAIRAENRFHVHVFRERRQSALFFQWSPIFECFWDVCCDAYHGEHSMRVRFWILFRIVGIGRGQQPIEGLAFRIVVISSAQEVSNTEIPAEDNNQNQTHDARDDAHAS